MDKVASRIRLQEFTGAPNYSGLISTSKRFNINTFITINYAKSTFVCQSKNDFIRVLIGLYELSC